MNKPEGEIPTISVPSRAGSKNCARIKELLEKLTSFRGSYRLKLSLDIPGEKEFIRAILIRRDSKNPSVIIQFFKDYTVFVVSCANQSRKWDFWADWREGVAQVLRFLDDVPNQTIRRLFDEKATALQEASKKAGY